MILLDTNVVSELAAPAPDATVLAWLDRQSHPELWVTAITTYELTRGLEAMAPGRRRAALQERVEAVVRVGLQGRTLSLDPAAAEEAGRLNARRQARGLIVDLPDTLIAGIAVSRRATLATRNVRHFADLPTPVVDPWAA